MSDETRRDEKREGAAEVSRRRFLESAGSVGGAAAIISVATTVGCSAQNSNNSTQDNGNSTQAGNIPRLEPTAPAELMGEMVEYKSGDMMIPAYLSRPKTRRVWPGSVLVIHEVFGLNDHIKAVADRIAGEGYPALAPNFFVRAPEPPPKGTEDMEAIRKAAQSIPNEAFVKDALAGLDYLRTVKGAKARFASIGFCMGGGFSYRLAAAGAKDLMGAVIFYGRTPIELVPQISCPLLGNFGANDTGIPPEKVKELEEALKKAGKQADFKIYEGAGHGFFNDTRQASYNAAAAADAWQRTLKFFRERLGA